MKPGFRQSMASLHSWAGLVPGWLMFIIFLFGTTAYFQREISEWMRPELGRGEVKDAALDNASRFLAARAPDAASWSLALPPLHGGSGLWVSWEPREGSAGKGGGATLDPVSGREVVLRDTEGGGFLYNFHYELHYMPWWLGRYLVILAALAMLVTLLSGVVTHKKIFADFFLLRLGKGQRSWLDTHNVTGVLALPFHLMITYTGLATLLFMAMPWAISANFPDPETFAEAALPSGPQSKASGIAAPSAPLGELVERAHTARDGFTPGYVTIRNPGDAAAIVEIQLLPDQIRYEYGTLYLSGVTGEILQRPPQPGPASATAGVMIGLHAGRFANPALRWLYFLSGAGGTVMIASGLVLWTVKRRAKLADPAHPHFGFRLVERLNIGVIAGAPAGIAVYFLANRLLAGGLDHRADWEINSLFIAWGGLFVWTIARPARHAWIEALAVCAILYALVPIVSAFTTERGLISSLIARDWLFVGFDLMMLATAAAFTLAAWKVAAHKPKAATRRKTRALLEVL
ncbi:PepSY domain-containing protein [Sphingobium terrigena]|uniref:PepSY domain-containing protein n=1 Tax=Sphingobium terrigena TaxID=2304063 RepID=A0A418YUS8_9SPHN|nr:PepSY-associated TM helix domain-containing protein [Sphingobium terrigena]RJG55900.1 PepSY domain-containing protein [Sphingobium terrigena]